jgi:hypothetical protein
MGRKALFRLPLKLSCGPLWDFSDSLYQKSRQGPTHKRNSLKFAGTAFQEVRGHTKKGRKLTPALRLGATRVAMLCLPLTNGLQPWRSLRPLPSWRQRCTC